MMSNAVFIRAEELAQELEISKAKASQDDPVDHIVVVSLHDNYSFYISGNAG